MERKPWRWLVVVVTVISMVGATMAFAQKAPVPDRAPAPDPAPGQVTPLAVDTFGGRVEPGDQVRKGQVIGKLGNTGNTDAPHLHFMVIDGKSPLVSEALPFEIDRFGTRGTLTNYEAFLGGAPAEISPEQSGAQRDRLPLHRTVNDFR